MSVYLPACVLTHLLPVRIVCPFVCLACVASWLSVCLSIVYLSIHLPTCSSVYPPVCLPACLSACRPIYLAIWPSICPPTECRPSGTEVDKQVNGEMGEWTEGNTEPRTDGPTD